MARQRIRQQVANRPKRYIRMLGTRCGMVYPAVDLGYMGISGAPQVSLKLLRVLSKVMPDPKYAAPLGSIK